MSVALNSVGAITLFVEDVQRSKAFYQEVFGLSPIFEDPESAAFKLDNTIVNLLASSDPDGHVWEVAQEIA